MPRNCDEEPDWDEDGYVDLEAVLDFLALKATLQEEYEDEAE